MTTIAFTVPGTPVAQPRQRTRVMMMGGEPVAQNYTPARHPVTAFKTAVATAAAAVHKGEPIEGPVRVTVMFVMPRPGRLVWKTRPTPRCWSPVKPDVDNLFKSVADALNKLIWRDDSQVVSVFITKKYAAGHEQPCVEVEIVEL